MNDQPMTLDQRIAVALQPNAAVTAADIGALIEEVEAFIAKAENDWNDERRSGEPGTVRQGTMNAALTATRLQGALPKLRARYAQMREEEQTTVWLAERRVAWQAKHDLVKRERDALAEEWREVYPDPARKIADLAVRTAANNDALAQVYVERPAGVEQRLVSAELHARALDGLSDQAPSLVTSLRLFDWDSGHQICPPPPQAIASVFASTMMPASDRRLSADWAEAREQAVARERAEQQRMADHYSQMTKTQEDRENAEARERFFAHQPKNGG